MFILLYTQPAIALISGQNSSRFSSNCETRPLNLQRRPGANKKLQRPIVTKAMTTKKAMSQHALTSGHTYSTDVVFGRCRRRTFLTQIVSQDVTSSVLVTNATIPQDQGLSSMRLASNDIECPNVASHGRTVFSVESIKNSEFHKKIKVVDIELTRSSGNGLVTSVTEQTTDGKTSSGIKATNRKIQRLTLCSQENRRPERLRRK
ncbi:hypothetical protein EVAR_85789_1 [Eumeta japonica]|uniref:Uncharacterized protein n=1 Tax=Eumeta variegata TaxID=151549 RepID=A0A4C1UQU2_EUMVA|nr:hypothetical protein EVAR_85789_1 [Eumeta japonica]